MCAYPLGTDASRSVPARVTAVQMHVCESACDPLVHLTAALHP